MELFLDSSNPREIMEVRSWGLLSGVTSNPGLISAAGRGEGPAGARMEKTLAAIVEASPGPVFVQVIGWHEMEPLLRQARWLHAFSDKIIVKLPMSIAGIQALLQLKQELPDLRLAVTAVASISQAYLVGKAGADIVAIFNGPLDQVEDVAHDMITPVRRIYDNYGFKTRILACGRYPRLFGEVAVAGADICTMKIEFFRLLYEHSFTDLRMNGFMESWRGAFGDATWPEKA